MVAAFAREFPGVTYDVTIKIEHLLQHREHLSELGETGCAFVTSAVESVDDGLLAKLEKGHTRADFEQAAAEMRAAGLPLVPTFVAFTPWTSLRHYADLVATVDQLGLIEHVAPVQWSIRLLIPRGSRLLELEDVRALVDPFDPVALAFPWRHPDARMDALQRRVAAIVGDANGAPRDEIAHAIVDEIAAVDPAVRVPLRADAPSAGVPHVTEPWYCCAEPTEGQAALSEPAMTTRRVLLFATTTGYQIRMFDDAARRLGIDLRLVSDRCQVLDDPWRDHAIPVQYHDPDASLRTLEQALAKQAIDGVLAVGDRPAVLAARAAWRFGVPWHSVAGAEASRHKVRARERFRDARACRCRGSRPSSRARIRAHSIRRFPASSSRSCCPRAAA